MSDEFDDVILPVGSAQVYGHGDDLYVDCSVCGQTIEANEAGMTLRDLVAAVAAHQSGCGWEDTCD